MTLLTRWDPFREFALMQNRMSRMYQDYTPGMEEQLSSAQIVPPVDVYEDEHHLTLKAELPGVDPKDVDVRVENNILTMKGERKFEKEEKEENFHRIERRYGTFTRSFALPNTVNPDSVKADYENGVLKIEFEKRAEAKPKQIQVNIGQRMTLEGKGKAA